MFVITTSFFNVYILQFSVNAFTMWWNI